MPEDQASLEQEYLGRVLSPGDKINVGGGIEIAPGAVHITSPGYKSVTFDLAGASDQAIRVVDEVLAALNLFLEKNKGYGSTGYNLGAKGQYADMNRKMGKLKHTLWDGNPAVGESITEMLQDLIGHAGLTIDYIKMEEDNK